MQAQDKVKIRIYNGGFGHCMCYIVSREMSESIVAKFESDGGNGVHFEGRLNDADGNKTSVSMMKDVVGAIEVLEINSEF